MDSGLELFLKKNRKENKEYELCVTKSFLDENGEPIKWKIRVLNSKEYDDIRKESTYDVKVKGKKNMYNEKIDTTKMMKLMICKCIVFPNLYDKALQDSYGVMTPEDLLNELIGNIGEYNELLEFVCNINGVNDDIEDLVEEAKN